MTIFNIIKDIESGRMVFVLFILLFVITSCEKDEIISTNEVTTSEISFISETKASGGGYIYNGGKSTVSSRGICWGTESMPTINDHKTMDGVGDGSFISALTDLIPNTMYHVRAYAMNKDGISYGNNVTFTTKNSEVPLLNTIPISEIKSTGCTSGGTVLFEGHSDVLTRGVCWSVHNPPTIMDSKTINGTGLGNFTSNITGLDPTASYYIRAYATNNNGTGYGELRYLKPFASTITDIDGNTYTTVSIGTQVWTVENLNVTKYQNGDPIENIADNGLWNLTRTGAYCDYENNPANSNTYGRLYNWYAASDQRNIAPKGWRVATYDDYLILIDYLGGFTEAEEKMINEGFKALPGGKRNRDGNFHDVDLFPYFWTSTEYHEGSAWARFLVLDGADLNIINLSKNYGFSVRCVRE